MDLRRIIQGLHLLVGLILVAGCLRPSGGSPSVTAPLPTVTDAAVPVSRRPAPDFALSDLEGNVLHLNDLRGQAVLINFWATW